MRINFEDYFRSLTQQFSGKQKRIPINAPVGVFYGLSNEGYLRLSILSLRSGPQMESTKQLRVTQGEESKAGLRALEKTDWLDLSVHPHSAR